MCRNAIAQAAKPIVTTASSYGSAVSAGSYAGCAAGLANNRSPSHAPTMFVVTEEDEAAIRAAFEQRGEFAAAVELRRLFPGITDNAQARQCARTIAGWKPLRPVKRAPKVPQLLR